MKKEFNNPLTLSKLMAITYGNDIQSENDNNNAGEDNFDSRHDFAINKQQSGLGLEMIFSNELSIRSGRTLRGLRRRVTVSLTDVNEGVMLAKTEIMVAMSKYDEIKKMRVDFPLAYANIDCEHTYMVQVRDETSHLMLGEEMYHLFDEKIGGRHVTRWFEVENAGISPNYTRTLYKALKGIPMTYHTVTFNMRMQLEEEPWLLPEMEVRVHYPNGEVDARFCTIVCDDFDMKEYHVDMPFLVQYENLGICYAELICLDYPLAGIVFSTSTETINGPWSGGDLEILEEYSLEAATEQFRRRTQEESGEGEDESEDSGTEEDEYDPEALAEFDKLLDQFIASELGTDGDKEEEKSESEDENEEAEEENGDEDEDESEESGEEEEEEPLMTLDGLTGLATVKRKLAAYEKTVRFNNLRLENGLPTTTMPLHAMFLGSPGTGKTTVAKMMGMMLRRAGVLSRGHVVVKERATLLGPYYSNEETNTQKAIEEAQGGILLIDEAYQLYQPNDPKDPGKFVIEALMTALADDTKRDWMLILAGYPEEMKRMKDMNPGLRSRIPDTNIYEFEDFSEPELMEIAERYLKVNGYELSDDGREALAERLGADYTHRDKNFGNARHVMNVIQTEVLPAMAIRVIEEGDVSADALRVIKGVDVPQPIRVPDKERGRIGYRCA